MEQAMIKRLNNERGAALLETAITIPLVLLVTVSIFEFGRAYQTWQVLTNAAREGARTAVIAGNTDTQVTDNVRAYMQGGQLPAYASASISINRNVPFGSVTASTVSVTYPFQFTVLNPVIRLVTPSSMTGQGTTNMSASATMRNE
jgi:Flp pilus assembly protein TadG